MAFRIVHIVCENGLGHFKRAIGLLNQLLKRVPSAKIDLICTQTQVEKISDWEKAKILDLPNLTIHTGITSPGVHWFNDESIYDSERLVKWHNLLQSFSALHEADIVISDNLVAPLKYRSDTLLMGSFLWLDVFEKSSFTSQSVSNFIIEQQKILSTNRPNMLCVGDVKMPILSKYTNPITMPWFGQVESRKRNAHARTNHIAILGGATHTINSIMKKVIRCIVTKSEYSVVTPQRIIDQLGFNLKNKVLPFNFRIEDFQNCDLVICRPGIGTITDAISTQTPMIFIYEKDNIEMSFNAEQLAKKGIALNLGDEFDDSFLLEKMNHIYDNQYQSMVEILRGIPTNGFEVAADWIFDNYLDSKNFNYVD